MWWHLWATHGQNGYAMLVLSSFIGWEVNVYRFHHDENVHKSFTIKTVASSVWIWTSANASRDFHDFAKLSAQYSSGIGSHNWISTHDSLTSLALMCWTNLKSSVSIHAFSFETLKCTLSTQLSHSDHARGLVGPNNAQRYTVMTKLSMKLAWIDFNGEILNAVENSRFEVFLRKSLLSSGICHVLKYLWDVCPFLP